MNLLPLPLGPALVAAACRTSGHDVVLLNLMFEEDMPSAIRNCLQAFHPEVVGISVRNIDDQNMADPKFLLPPVREVVKTCRSLSDAPIVVGGAGYSIFPVSALRYLGADMGICGEGEAAFSALLERVAMREPVSGLPGLYLPGQRPADRVFASNLDALPLPEPDLWIPSVRGKSEFWVPVQSRRGCPLDCTFCSTGAIEGRTLRAHSPEAIAAWLEQLVSSGFTNFNFVDNTFNLPPDYAKELCRK
ncbi:MAG: cobalamin-dependent protein, partial [Acidobacteriota bacterium]|nr:cobalamin-dependent protein [Acidobacteriota bacterium]